MTNTASHWSPPVSDTLDINTIHVYIYKVIYTTIIHIFNKHDIRPHLLRYAHTHEYRKKERKSLFFYFFVSFRGKTEEGKKCTIFFSRNTTHLTNTRAERACVSVSE